MALNLLVFMLSWTVSFICSGYEIGFLSVNEIKINALAQKGNKSAKIMSRLLKDKEKVLTVLLILNTLTLVLLTFSFGKIIYYIFSTGVPESLETIILTLIVFTTCELFPKSLFRIYSFELTRKLSYFVFVAYIIFYPISWVFSVVSQRIKKSEEPQNQNYRLHEVAKEGARRRLLPDGISVLVGKISDKNIRFCDICKDVKTTIYCGKNNIIIKSTQYMDEIIGKKLLWNYDTIECRDLNKNVYYPTVEILDSFFKIQKS
jgi:Mg2+/Co2+ transporter CorB